VVQRSFGALSKRVSRGKKTGEKKSESSGERFALEGRCRKGKPPPQHDMGKGGGGFRFQSGKTRRSLGFPAKGYSFGGKTRLVGST